MSVKQSTQQLRPLHMMRLRRASAPRSYLRLDEPALILGTIIMICIVSVLFLAQTGRVTTAGLRLQELEREHVHLLHEVQQYQYRIAKASRLDGIAERAQVLGLRPAKAKQLRYTTIEQPEVPMVAATLDDR
jgi:hypothetical protein